MYARKGQPKESKSQAVAHSVAHTQRGVRQTVGFLDNRPEAIAQRKLQAIANNHSPQSSQHILRAMAENIPFGNRAGQGAGIVQRKTLAKAGLNANLTENPAITLNSTTAGPSQGKIYTKTIAVPPQTDKPTALIKAGELNGEVGTRYDGKFLQNKTEVRTKPLKDGDHLQDTLGSKLSGKLRTDVTAIPHIKTSPKLVAAPLMKAEIALKAPIHVAALTKLSPATIAKFAFDWDQLYKGDHRTTIRIITSGGVDNTATPKFNFGTINKPIYVQEYTLNGLASLKAKLKKDFPTADTGKIDAITVTQSTNVTVNVVPAFQTNFEAKVDTAVTTNQLINIDEIAHIDPFVYRSKIPFRPLPVKTMELDFQHAEDWPGYVTKVKETGGSIDAEMQTANISSPLTAGIADKYSNVHGDTGGTVLTGNLDVLGTDSREENEKKIDSHTKIAGEGSRFKCVRDSATAGTLTNDTYFYTDEVGTNSVVNPGIKFSDLWKAWSSEFGKKYDIDNTTIKNKLKNCPNGDITLMSATIKVQANSDAKTHTHKL